MGEVFKAFDSRTERDVALKMLGSDFGGSQQLERFKQEARTIAKLEHPFIVPLYDFNLAEGDEPPFLVMRLMSGGTLAERIQDGSLNNDDIVQITRRLAAALDVAHARGLVHRDIKPGNILLDQDGYSYLADFGIVKNRNADLSLTHGGQLGTPSYMSPEQIQSGKLDQRSDIYAMGVVVFEMLTGRTPFLGNFITILQGHLNEDLPPVYSFVPEMPDEVDIVLRKAMAKKPEDRYTKASEMAYELQGALESQTAFVRAQHTVAETPELVARIVQGDSGSGFDLASLPPTAPSITLPKTIKVEPSRSRKLLVGGGVLALLLLALFGWNYFNQDDQTTTVESTAVSRNPNTIEKIETPRPPTPLTDTILVLEPDDNAVWQNDDVWEKLPEDGRIPLRNSSIQFQSGKTSIELLLPNLVRIILDVNTKLRVETESGDENEFSLQLEQGRILVKSEQPVKIYNEAGYEASLLQGAIGVEVDLDATQWQVDCLAGNCQQWQTDRQVLGDLFTFQSAQVSLGTELILIETQHSRLETYQNLDGSIRLPTHTPTATHTPLPAFTPAPSTTPSVTPFADLRGSELTVLGQSAGGHDIELMRFGNGPQSVLLVGGIHSGTAPNTVEVAQQLINYFVTNITAVPNNVTLYIIPNLNPDAVVAPGEARGRLNANGVDLNRNWDCHWERDAQVFSETVAGSGGSEPFSEPEVQALKTFIEQNNPQAILFWGASSRQSGWVSPGACEIRSLVSVPLVQYYALPANYEYISRLEVAPADNLTGDVSSWLDDQGIPAIFVILSKFDRESLDFNKELDGVLSVLSAVAVPQKVQQTPTPIGCPLLVNFAWRTLYDNNQSRLGCATSEVVQPQAVWQHFENGRMLWREDTDEVYVLYDNGSTNNFLVNDPALSDFRESELIKGAIGYVYSTYTAVSANLGLPPKSRTGRRRCNHSRFC